MAALAMAPAAVTRVISSGTEGAASLRSDVWGQSALGPAMSRLSISAQPASASPARGLQIRSAIKRWERKEVKPNSLPVRIRMHVKVGDTVQIIAGKDKGKVSEVVSIFSHNSTVVCRDVNLKTKHVKGKAQGEAGQIVQMEAPVHSSNVMLYSRTEKVASRVGHKLLEDGSKVRYLLKTGEVIDKPGEWKRAPKKEKKGGAGPPAPQA